MNTKKKYIHISVYCDEKERIRWTKKAKKKGMCLSDWIRDCIYYKLSELT